jgi:hypothetical protein
VRSEKADEDPDSSLLLGTRAVMLEQVDELILERLRYGLSRNAAGVLRRLARMRDPADVKTEMLSKQLSPDE